MYKLPEDLDSKYRFVTVASKRAEQLQSGAPPRVQARQRKFTVVAQEEVAEGLIELFDAEKLAQQELEAAEAAEEDEG